MKTPILLLIFLLFCQSCKIVPVQTGNIILAETFKQSFDFDKENNKGIKQNADNILKKIIGAATINELIKNGGKTKQYHDIIGGKCESWGNAQIVLSVIPNSIIGKNHFQFYVSGNGRYYIYLKSDQTIYYSSDFSIVQDMHDVDELRQGKVIVKFKQQLTNHFSYDEGASNVRSIALRDSANKSFNYVNQISTGLRDHRSEEAIEVHIRLNTDLADNNIYSINYEVKHEVWIGNDFIGYMEFEKPKYPINSINYKLMDLRGIEFIRKDYEKLQKKAIKLHKSKVEKPVESSTKTQSAGEH
jgi:hypothetical protein